MERLASQESNLHGAYLQWAHLSEADLHGANLSNASLGGANLLGANLRGANLQQAGLGEAFNVTVVPGMHFLSRIGANLSEANLSDANLTGADLSRATLVKTNLTGADLTGCRIHGVSAWDLELEGAKQQNLVITAPDEPEITVDKIEVAQFVYLLLRHEKIRDVIDTIGKKGVLLLGRFTEGRMVVLERLREKLRDLGFVPMRLHRDGSVAG